MVKKWTRSRLLTKPGMDSFYDAPRMPPVPTAINRIERIPVVPEVSVIENSFYDANIRPQFGKNQYITSLPPKAKHVRFQNSCPLGLPNVLKENAPEPLKTAPDLKGKTFKQIYMANVPDRHLDLSVFEPACSEAPPQFERISFKKPDCVSRQSPSQETEVLKSIENFSSTRHYQYQPPCSCDSYEISNRVKAPETCNEIARASDEPTIKDLYKIIQQQNEQIMLLQRQVNNLKSSLREPELQRPQLDSPKDHRNSPTKKGLFSIDFQAASFEVSFRPPPNAKFRKPNEIFEPKIQEILECERDKDLSLHLDESLHVRDSYVSAVPSIQINMDEYQSSEEDESSSVNIGLTFYKDLMDQVNNVLKKIQIQSECQMVSKTGPTMTAVKQATLQHLKSIGVNLSPIQETNEMTGGGSDCGDISEPTEVSFAVKQLLMKYLPDDKLTKAINKQKEAPIKEKKKLKPAGSEFSFATLQYLKKYNLIDNSRKLPEIEMKSDSPKILDVTALKRQPKLL